MCYFFLVVHAQFQISFKEEIEQTNYVGNWKFLLLSLKTIKGTEKVPNEISLLLFKLLGNLNWHKFKHP